MEESAVEMEMEVLNKTKNTKIHGSPMENEVWTKQELELFEEGKKPTQEHIDRKREQLHPLLSNMKWTEPLKSTSSKGSRPMKTEIIIVGRPGVGKSATANTLMRTSDQFHDWPPGGREPFPTDPGMQQDSYTGKTNSVSLPDTNHWVTDTPSITLKRHCSQMLHPMVQPNEAKRVFLYVIKGTRFTQEIKDDIIHNLNVYPEMSERTILVITHGNEMFQGTSVKEYLKKGIEDETITDDIHDLIKFRSIVGIQNYNAYTDQGPCGYVQHAQRQALLGVIDRVASTPCGRTSNRTLRILYGPSYGVEMFWPNVFRSQILITSSCRVIAGGQVWRPILLFISVLLFLIILILVIWQAVVLTNDTNTAENSP